MSGAVTAALRRWSLAVVRNGECHPIAEMGSTLSVNPPITSVRSTASMGHGQRSDRVWFPVVVFYLAASCFAAAFSLLQSSTLRFFSAHSSDLQPPPFS